MNAELIITPASTAQFIDLLTAFQRAGAAKPDIYALAKGFASYAYMFQKDKGSEDSIWHHVENVKERVKSKYAGLVSEERMLRLKALAIMHEVLELTDKTTKQPLFTANDLLAAGFDKDFVEDVVAMRVRPGKLYLDEVRELAKRPNAVLVKLCDLDENMSPRKIDPRAFSETLRAKKAVLYPATHAFLSAVSIGEIQAPYMSVKEYVMGNRLLPDTVRNEAVLAQYCSDQQRYERLRAIPGLQTFWNLHKAMAGRAGWRSSLAI